MSWLTLVWSAISGNRIISYLVLGLMAVGLLTTVIFQIRKQGASAERSKQLSDALSSLQKEWKRRAEIDSLERDVARRRLRDRWSIR